MSNQIFLSQGLGMGIGVGLIFTPCTAAVSVQFRNSPNRLFALGIALSGSSFGSLIFPISKSFHNSCSSISNVSIYSDKVSLSWSNISIMGYWLWISWYQPASTSPRVRCYRKSYGISRWRPPHCRKFMYQGSPTRTESSSRYQGVLQRTSLCFLFVGVRTTARTLVSKQSSNFPFKLWHWPSRMLFPRYSYHP